MEAPFNTFNVPALAWCSDHSRSPVLVGQGHQAPQSTTILTIQSLSSKNIAVWSRHDHILLPTDFDVLGGRGKHGRNHPGNAHFTGVVSQFTQAYRTASSARRSAILNEILVVHMNNRQGRRFLKLQLYDRRGIWRWIVDPRPREKIGNKMRDMIAALHTPRVLLLSARPPVAELPVENHTMGALRNNSNHLVAAQDPAHPQPAMMGHVAPLVEDPLMADLVGLADDDPVQALDNLDDIFEDKLLLHDERFLESLALVCDTMIPLDQDI